MEQKESLPPWGRGRNMCSTLNFSLGGGQERGEGYMPDTKNIVLVCDQGLIRISENPTSYQGKRCRGMGNWNSVRVTGAWRQRDRMRCSLSGRPKTVDWVDTEKKSLANNLFPKHKVWLEQFEHCGALWVSTAATDSRPSSYSDNRMTLHPHTKGLT